MEISQRIIDVRTTPWGIMVRSIETLGVTIHQDLKDSMSRQAQAERERQARVILGEAEMQIAESFSEASQVYRANPARRRLLLLFHVKQLNSCNFVFILYILQYYLFMQFIMIQIDKTRFSSYTISYGLSQ